tara:strand:+ start:418 stop:675 length:258 start_codon:yes stop_codon:yes gene_type:complete
MLKKLLIITSFMLFSAPSMANTCESWCKWTPPKAWPDIPECSACTEEGKRQCAAYCKWVPENVWPVTEGCQKCNETAEKPPLPEE